MKLRPKSALKLLQQTTFERQYFDSRVSEYIEQQLQKQSNASADINTNTKRTGRKARQFGCCGSSVSRA